MNYTRYIHLSFYTVQTKNAIPDQENSDPVSHYQEASQEDQDQLRSLHFKNPEEG